MNVFNFHLNLFHSSKNRFNSLEECTLRVSFCAFPKAKHHASFLKFTEKETNKKKNIRFISFTCCMHGNYSNHDKRFAQTSVKMFIAKKGTKKKLKWCLCDAHTDDGDIKWFSLVVTAYVFLFLSFSFHILYILY